MTATTTLGGRAVLAGRLLGWFVVAGSIAYVAARLWQDAPWQVAAAHLMPLLAATTAGALLYGGAGFLLSSGWHQLLGTDGPSASARWHHAVYGRTQIAKYVPGNVFHFVGRQVLGRRLGHGQGRLALASALEIGLLVAIAGGLSLPMILPWLGPVAVWCLMLAGLLLALLGPIAGRWTGLDPAGTGRMGLQAKRSIALRLVRAAPLYAGFFGVVALILWMLAASVGDRGWASIELATSASVVALAWLVGFATPGSSAGIGVREAVLIAALEGTLGMSASTLVALALRVISVAGDVAFLAISAALVPWGDWTSAMIGEDCISETPSKP